MRAVAIVVLSRANYARIKSVLKAVNEHPDLTLKLFVGGSMLDKDNGYPLNILSQDGFAPTSILKCQPLDNSLPSMAIYTGQLVEELAKLFVLHQPDVALTVADRHETLSTSIASAYMNIHLAHTQGGEVTGSIDESVRHASTRLAHIHFPATTAAANILEMMGEEPFRIKLTGCPSLDLLSISKEYDIYKLKRKLGINEKSRYSIVLQHPVTTEYSILSNTIQPTIEALELISGNYEGQFVYLLPNADPGSSLYKQTFSNSIKRTSLFSSKLVPISNISPELYGCLLYNSDMIIGNSSSGIREASFLGIPSINIGNRQMNRQRSNNVLDVDYDSTEISRAFFKQLEHQRYSPSDLYGSGDAGFKIAKFLANKELPPLQKQLNYNFHTLYKRHLN